MERRFRCTACGKCCYGWIPLTLGDAVRHAGRFPLAMVWSAVPQTARSFALTSSLGMALKLPKGPRIGVLISATAYIPPGYPCPELAADGRCAIHEDKPLRCRTMPFYPYKDEQDQADALVPRKGWGCDVSDTAPVVYRDRRIVEREDFEAERRELLADAAAMRAYGAYALKYMPSVIDTLGGLSRKPGGNLLTGLSSFLTAVHDFDATAIARAQLPVLRDFAARTEGSADLAEYHRNYAGWAREMEYLAQATAD